MMQVQGIEAKGSGSAGSGRRVAGKNEGLCPLFQAGTGMCLVSDFPRKVKAARRRSCCSDDYDDCPTYLGYLLRYSRPLRNDNDWFDRH